jgi:purine-binding chemotaxis protein CheW
MSEPTTEARAGFEALYKRLEEAERTLARGADLSPDERGKILSERALALAGTREQTRARSPMEVVAFKVGGERYAVPIEKVDEILEIKGLCPLLGAPRHVLGAMVARSRVLAVLDLRQVLGLSGGGMSDLTKVVAVLEGEELFGIAVEEVEGKLELDRPDHPVQTPGPFLFVSADRLAVLDLAGLSEPAAPAAG